MSERALSCAISGSFKFKDKIDSTQDEFESYGVTVLAPDKGWIGIHPTRLYTPRDFRPLPTEQNMSIRHIEDRFLHAISLSDFLYVVALHGYIGDSTSMEIGAAIAKKKPVFLSDEISLSESLEFSLYIKEKAPIKSVKETVIYMKTYLKE